MGKRGTAVLLAVMVALAGCVGAPGPAATDTGAPEPASTAPASPTGEPPRTLPSATASGTATAPAPPGSDAGSGDTACVVGRWSLDLADYQTQAAAWLKATGVPITQLRITGHQLLDLNLDVITVSTDLTVTGRVPGSTVTARTGQQGQGEWFWNAVDPSILEVENWADLTPSDEPGEPPPVPLFDVSTGGVKVTCSGDRLELHGPGAPLVGRFTRVR